MNVSAPSVDITHPSTFKENLENVEPTNLNVVETTTSKKYLTGKRIRLLNTITWSFFCFNLLYAKFKRSIVHWYK